MQILWFFLCLGLVFSHPHSSEECQLSEKYQMKMMSPFGCMDLKPSMGMKNLLKDCFMRPLRELAGNAMLGKIPSFSSMREQLAKAIECKYKTAGVLENGRFSSAKVEEYFDEAEMEGEDVDKFIEFTIDCTNNLNTDGSVVKQAVEVETCISNSMIEFCENRGETTGTLPYVASMITIAYKNDSCSKVEIPAEVGETYADCLKNPTDKNMDKFLKGTSGMKRAILEAILKVPEIRAMCCVGERLSLADEDGGTDFNAIGKYVEGFDGWQDGAVKNAVVEGVYDCAAKADEEEEDMFEKGMIFNKCFLPKLGSTCGFDNAITKDFFYPFFDPGMIEGIAGSFKDAMGKGSQLKSMFKMMKKKIMMFGQKMLMDGEME